MRREARKQRKESGRRRGSQRGVKLGRVGLSFFRRSSSFNLVHAVWCVYSVPHLQSAGLRVLRTVYCLLLCPLSVVPFGFPLLFPILWQRIRIQRRTDRRHSFPSESSARLGVDRTAVAETIGSRQATRGIWKTLTCFKGKVERRTDPSEAHDPGCDLKKLRHGVGSRCLLEHLRVPKEDDRCTRR